MTLAHTEARMHIYIHLHFLLRNAKGTRAEHSMQIITSTLPNHTFFSQLGCVRLFSFSSVLFSNINIELGFLYCQIVSVHAY